MEALCQAVIGEMVADGRPSDDVAMLAARLTPLGDRLVSRWPAQAETLASIRHLMRRWLHHHGVTEDQTYDVMVACQEACANAVEHAYAPGEEAFEVEAELRDRTIEITVRDHGVLAQPAWTAPRPWDADHAGADGQRAGRAHRGWHRRRAAAGARRTGHRMTSLAELEDEWHDDVPVARLRGEVDASNAGECGDHLRALLSNRSVALVVDLSETTYLDSAGINVLFALAEEMRGRQQHLGLVVGDSSPISRMISLTGLDRTVAVHPTLPQALDGAGEDA